MSRMLLVSFVLIFFFNHYEKSLTFLKIFQQFIYLFSVVLDLHCCAGFPLVVTSEGHSLVEVHRFLCKEIQPVHPKGDQSWVFIGGIDVEAETPILWPPDVES